MPVLILRTENNLQRSDKPQVEVMDAWEDDSLRRKRKLTYRDRARDSKYKGSDAGKGGQAYISRLRLGSLARAY